MCSFGPYYLSLTSLANHDDQNGARSVKSTLRKCKPLKVNVERKVVSQAPNSTRDMIILGVRSRSAVIVARIVTKTLSKARSFSFIVLELRI